MEKLPRYGSIHPVDLDTYYASSLYDMQVSGMQVIADQAERLDEWYSSLPSMIELPKDVLIRISKVGETILHALKDWEKPNKHTRGECYVYLSHVRHDPLKDISPHRNSITIFDTTGACEIEIPTAWNKVLLQKDGANIDAQALTEKAWGSGITVRAQYLQDPDQEYIQVKSSLRHVENRFAAKRCQQGVGQLAPQFATVSSRK